MNLWKIPEINQDSELFMTLTSSKEGHTASLVPYVSFSYLFYQNETQGNSCSERSRREDTYFASPTINGRKV